MKRKIGLLILGFVLLFLALCAGVYYMYLTKDFGFECNSNCSGSSNLSFEVKVNKFNKKLEISKKGDDYFSPYLPADNKTELSYDITNKYQKDNKNYRVTLNSNEYKNVKELFEINEITEFKNSMPFMTILLNLAYDDNDYCLNSKDCLNDYKNYDKNNDNKITYREVANSMFDTYIKYYKENDDTSPYSNKLLLSEFKCKKDDTSCTKVVTSNYGDKNHKIKIKYYYKESDGGKKASTYYKVSIDGKKVDESKVMDFIVLKNDSDEVDDNQNYTYIEDLKTNLNFGGQIFVLGDNTIGFLKVVHISQERSTEILDFYQNNKKVGETINLPSRYADTNLKVNKNSLTFLYPNCQTSQMEELDFSVKNMKLNITNKSSKNMNEDEKSMLEDNDYCYNKTANKIEKQKTALGE